MDRWPNIFDLDEDIDGDVPAKVHLPWPKEKIEPAMAELDFFMWVYNRTFVELDEEAVNRATKVIFARHGMDVKIGGHKYCYKTDANNPIN